MLHSVGRPVHVILGESGTNFSDSTSPIVDKKEGPWADQGRMCEQEKSDHRKRRTNLQFYTVHQKYDSRKKYIHCEEKIRK